MKYPKPIDYYTNESSQPLLFHVLEVGEGLMILIVFPNNTTMLYDCNILDDTEEIILEYLEKNIPFKYDYENNSDSQSIDIFVNSHRDEDHLRGLSKINKRFCIKSIWDSGETGATTLSNSYQYYMNLRREIRRKYGENAVIIPNPSLTPIRQLGTASVFCFNSSLDFSEDIKTFTEQAYLKLIESSYLKEAKIQHTNSIVLSIKYAGRSILLPGDSDWKAWKEKIIPNFANTGLLDSEVLIASHHGSRSFFTDENVNDTIDPEANPETTYIESLEYIKPTITIISCGEYQTTHHPNKDALKLYKKHTSYDQVYTIYNKGSLSGSIDKLGNWTVTPIRFCPKSNIFKNFRINCEVEYEGITYSANSGEDIPIGSNLHFTLTSNFGMFDPYSEIFVIFEVSNGGIRNDHQHQEIYYKEDYAKGTKTEFFRDVAYHGKHLLRCTVKNREKHIKATQIFEVNGIRE